jgi:hypothetical protein
LAIKSQKSPFQLMKVSITTFLKKKLKEHNQERNQPLNDDFIQYI